MFEIEALVFKSLFEFVSVFVSEFISVFVFILSEVFPVDPAGERYVGN